MLMRKFWSIQGYVSQTSCRGSLLVFCVFSKVTGWWKGSAVLVCRSPPTVCYSSIVWIFFRLSFIDSICVQSSSIVSRRFVKSAMKLLNLCLMSKLWAICPWVCSGAAAWAGPIGGFRLMAGLGKSSCYRLRVRVPYGFDAMRRLAAAFCTGSDSFFF